MRLHRAEQAQAVKAVARAHQTLIWERTRTFQRMRASLRECYPAVLNAYADLTLTSADALELKTSTIQARFVRNNRLAAALQRQVFCAPHDAHPAPAVTTTHNAPATST
ncbi:hypothetical protein ABT272_44395 [Streptomyces sp900105245]|uniref:Transposase n=1 Tax=Streptomyces sp. 900105245 TaxID=3154379 RepID=A0ABV1UMP8_9ACTN